MGVFSFMFNQRKPRKFAYQPRYYDPVEEAKLKRRKILEQEALRLKGVTIPESEYVSNIKGQFRAKKEARSNFKHRQNLRIILVFIVLLYFAYVFYSHL